MGMPSMPSSGMPMGQPMGQPMAQMGMMGMPLGLLLHCWAMHVMEMHVTTMRSPMGMNPMMMMNPMMGMMWRPRPMKTGHMIKTRQQSLCHCLQGLSFAIQWQTWNSNICEPFGTVISAPVQDESHGQHLHWPRGSGSPWIVQSREHEDCTLYPFPNQQHAVNSRHSRYKTQISK